MAEECARALEDPRNASNEAWSQTWSPGPAPSAREPTYWTLESRPWVMTPVNLVVLLVSTSIHWV